MVRGDERKYSGDRVEVWVIEERHRKLVGVKLQKSSKTNPAALRSRLDELLRRGRATRHLVGGENVHRTRQTFAVIKRSNLLLVCFKRHAFQRDA